MNGLERVRRRLRGEAVDRAPNFDIYMTRAAHHVGRPLSQYYLDSRALVEANLAVCAEFDLDIVQALSDPYREAVDMGLDVEFRYVAIPDDAVERQGDNMFDRDYMLALEELGRRMGADPEVWRNAIPDPLLTEDF